MILELANQNDFENLENCGKTCLPIYYKKKDLENLHLDEDFYIFKIHVGPGVKGYDPMFSGSNLPKGPTMAKWTRGEVIEASWSIWSNHGGGYQYRICPSDGSIPIDEKCFTSNVLPFATNRTIIRSPYGDFDDFDDWADFVDIAGM